MDEEALIRRTAVTYIQLADRTRLAKLLAGMLYDPVKTVRIEAAARLAGELTAHLDTEQQKVFRIVLQEFEAAMAYSGDFSSARYNLGNLYAGLDRPEEAILQYQAAFRIDNQFYAAKANLALLYNQLGQNDRAAKLLREALETQPELYELAYSLGLLLVEMQQFREALEFLEQASRGLPGRARIHYNLGLLYQHLQNATQAENKLRAALVLEPRNLDFQFGLADHYLKRGMFEEARPIAEDMVSMHPDNPVGSQILNYIQRNTGR
jgi:tetratricopeptide (TPR) repeat protein